MELWIRSQNKERLIKSNNIFIDYDPTYKDWCIETKFGHEYVYKHAWHIFVNDIKFGTYFNEERALEVLDEIQRHLVVINDKNDDVFYIYEMPKD